jgi:hypothetical protein
MGWLGMDWSGMDWLGMSRAFGIGFLEPCPMCQYGRITNVNLFRTLKIGVQE